MLPDNLPRGLIHETEVAIELLRRTRNEDLRRLQWIRLRKHEAHPERELCPRRAHVPPRRAHDSRGLALERRRRRRTRSPVDQILERRRNAEIVFRRGKEERIGF